MIGINFLYSRKVIVKNDKLEVEEEKCECNKFQKQYFVEFVSSLFIIIWIIFKCLYIISNNLGSLMNIIEL